MGDDLGEYYRKRAEEYEEIYHREDPIRQHEQDLITYSMQEALKDRDVLEVACGTGYCTQFLSETARSITANRYRIQGYGISPIQAVHLSDLF